MICGCIKPTFSVVVIVDVSVEIVVAVVTVVANFMNVNNNLRDILDYLSNIGLFSNCADNSGLLVK